jgi:hypothetical protein
MVTHPEPGHLAVRVIAIYQEVLLEKIDFFLEHGDITFCQVMLIQISPLPDERFN